MTHEASPSHNADAGRGVERGVRPGAWMRAVFEHWLLTEQGLEATWNESRSCYDEFAAHLAFRAWVAANRDATRYAWLREHMAYKIICHFPPDEIGRVPSLPFGEESWPGGMDAAIDARIRA